MSDENHELPNILGEDLGYLLGWVALGETLGDDDGEEAARAMGEAIVGCEEMQAIKSALRRAYWQYPVNIRTRIMQRDRLPDVVVEWVAHRHRQDRMGARLRPLVTWPMVATRTDVAVADDQRRVMCGDRVLAGQWSGVVAAQHGPFSWVVIDGINVPQTHATITLRPVENSDGE